MSRQSKRGAVQLPSPDFFDLAGSDPELLNSGRIPDPQPEHTSLFRWLARVFTAIEARLRARGDQSLRFLIGFFWAVVAAAGIFLLLGPIINAPMSFDDVIDSADIGEVEWVATDSHVDYSVSRDGDGFFIAEVSEHYVANFLNGAESSIERTLVTEYEGHDVEFEIGEVTIDGATADVDMLRRSTTTELTIRREDGQKLEGTADVVIEYTMRHLVTSEVDAATGDTVDQWDWPLLAPSWPQAIKGIEITLTLTPEVDAALVRNPKAYVGWLLLSATQWLEPDATTPEDVTYSFTNDDTLPPNADIWVTATFDSGTFELPPTTKLFWWQTWGPLLPLAVLAVIMLLALAARRVVWSDSAGDPWYLPRNEPPEDTSPGLAMRLMGRKRHVELVEALADKPRRPATKPAKRKRRLSLRRRSAGANASTSATRTWRADPAWLRRVAEVGMRAGRFGNSYLVAIRTAGWRKTDDPVGAGLRWKPDSYLRDSFIAAPIAITLLQWGLLRQLSHQTVLLVVWWPVLFVLASTVLAAIALAAVWRPRPLTRQGALTMQQLKGIDVWARATRLLDRGPIEDDLLPYAVLFESPRRAGRAVVEHAIRETGDRALASRWRSSGFISLPAILGFILSVAVLAGTIVTVSVKAPPYDIDRNYLTRFSDLNGTYATQTAGFDIEAELSRGPDGQAEIEVVEHLTVRFDEQSGSVPQYAREWQTSRRGTDLGFELTSVLIDGEAAPYEQLDQTDTASTVMHTRFPSALSGGLHEMEIKYTLHSAAVDTSDGGDSVQEIRWTAWFSFWDDTYYPNDSPFDGRAPVRPLRIELTIDPEVAGEVRSGGWIDYDHDRERDDLPLEHGAWYAPWVTETSRSLDLRKFDENRDLDDEYDPDDYKSFDLVVGSEETAEDGTITVSVDADLVQSRPSARYDPDRENEPDEPFTIDPEVNELLGEHELGLTSDLGAMLRFDEGTFAGVEPGTGSRAQQLYWLPYTLMMVFGGLISAVAIAVFAFAYRLRRAPSASLALTSFATLPILLVSQCVLFCWTVMFMTGGNGLGFAGFALGTLMFTTVIAQFAMVFRRAGTGGGPVNTSRGSQRRSRADTGGDGSPLQNRRHD